MKKHHYVLAAMLLLFSLFFCPAVRSDSMDELECMAKNIYHEARGESITGQVAVAAVTLNRVHDDRWPGTVCAVVHQPWQFSWTIGRYLTEANGRSYVKAMLISKMMLGGLLLDPTDGATHYHATWLKPPPDWAPSFEPTITIGQHIFYR